LPVTGDRLLSALVSLTSHEMWSVSIALLKDSCVNQPDRKGMLTGAVTSALERSVLGVTAAASRQEIAHRP
jgi:hypothetical protein